MHQFSAEGGGKREVGSKGGGEHYPRNLRFNGIWNRLKFENSLNFKFLQYHECFAEFFVRRLRIIFLRNGRWRIKRNVLHSRQSSQRLGNFASGSSTPRSFADFFRISRKFHFLDAKFKNSKWKMSNVPQKAATYSGRGFWRRFYDSKFGRLWNFLIFFFLLNKNLRFFFNANFQIMPKNWKWLRDFEQSVGTSDDFLDFCCVFWQFAGPLGRFVGRTMVPKLKVTNFRLMLLSF